MIAVPASQPAVLLEPLDARRIEHHAPDVGVVFSRIATGKTVQEIGGAIARRHHWQITPADFAKWNTRKNKKKKEAVMHAMWKMVKLDIKELKAAFDNA